MQYLHSHLPRVSGSLHYIFETRSLTSALPLPSNVYLAYKNYYVKNYWNICEQVVISPLELGFCFYKIGKLIIIELRLCRAQSNVGNTAVQFFVLAVKKQCQILFPLNSS